MGKGTCPKLCSGNCATRDSRVIEGRPTEMMAIASSSDMKSTGGAPETGFNENRMVFESGVASADQVMWGCSGIFPPPLRMFDLFQQMGSHRRHMSKGSP